MNHNHFIFFSQFPLLKKHKRYPTMSSLPHYITQDDEYECATMAKPIPTPSDNSEDSCPSIKSTSFVSSTSKKFFQINMFGKRVCPSKLKTKVKSYRKRNGTLVKKYSRKQPSETTAATKPPPVLFKRLKMSTSCKDSVDLAHSLYIDELRASIRSVGKPNESTEE